MRESTEHTQEGEHCQWRCVCAFPDGLVLLAYDPWLDDLQNAALEKAIASEGRRRLKIGQSDACVFRHSRDGDVIALPPNQKSEKRKAG